MVDLHIPYDEFARIAFHALAMMEAISQHAVEANDKGDGALFDLMDDLADEPGAMKILPDWKSIDGGNEPDGD